MACGRVIPVLLILALSNVIYAKVYETRCALTRDLLKLNIFQRTFMSNWVCMIEKETGKNTSFVEEKCSKTYYGMFHIGNEWCKAGNRKGGKCDISCNALLDDDIRDDAVCALKIFNMEGFKYWSKWMTRCKGQLLPDIEKCPDWEITPRQTSPIRDKRTSTRKYGFMLV